MKNRLLLTITILSLKIGFSQIIDFPDANFKSALLQQSPSIDTNNDSEIQISEALATKNIIASAKRISDVTGLEEFKNLERLNLFNNPITSISLTNQTKLKLLDLTFTDITELNLSTNKDLISLAISNTSISKIDVSNLNKLELLNVSRTDLSSIDVSNNLSLLNLEINFTKINSLEISSNSMLEFLSFRDTKISSLDFSLLPNLKSINVSDTKFTSLDFSNNPRLCSLSAKDCSFLEYIIIKNGNNQALAKNQGCSVSYSIGGGSSITSGIFADKGNPNLNFICVDDVSFAQRNFDLIPAQTQLISDCSSLSINEFSYEENIQIFSPVSETLEIQGDLNLKRIEIYNIQGKKVMDSNLDSNEKTVSVGVLPTGFFTALITTLDKRKITRKFLKR
ncbi:leucine-rich repeat domain-containing protein [Tenacibaculum jejuense]|uniref:Secretion system C-terminal sorting domain-containing protein n=1 Tax=Tenacibaculum jejuense TaxID=584609 RepID=A0A238U412_9FLAO|nr:T9SS type A sorting domain-containing protein [Tenacibaculum jejuense]SNR13949.1 Protein of unknown function precursor containing LLR domains and a C-terminal secretion signal [Tenacibaculum jejuense]